MKNKVVVTIAGQEYTMVAVEDEAYVRTQTWKAAHSPVVSD